MILWQHLGSSATQCDATNRQVSSWVTYVVCGVPPWISLQPLMLGDVRPEYRLMAWSFLCMACLCGSAGVLVELLGQGWRTSHCTYLGPWRHQIWPVLNMQYDLLPGWQGGVFGRFLSAGNLLLYMAASFGGFLTSRPSYVLPLLAAVGLNAQLLILFLGPEWGSFWCFQASLLSLVAFLEPQLFKALGEFNAFAPPRASSSQPVAGTKLGAAEELDVLVA